MDLICFSHLRWNFVYQRPQHLMKRAADNYRVYYFEEPLLTERQDYYELTVSKDKVIVITPYLQEDHSGTVSHRLQTLLKLLLHAESIEDYIFWYYTPLMRNFTESFRPDLIIYDCMDQLSAFKNASPLLESAEQELLQVADLVFTGGMSLYNSKKNMHHEVSCFPSSIDYEHFVKARKVLQEPSDQRSIPYPRLGFFGVIDERFDIELLRESAALRPDFQFVIIGPVVKIDPETLPRAKNIHYLGMKKYEELPAYISNWDISLLLFAINESTRYISPTKTPEYLAAGLPVISTPIEDVISTYGDTGLASIVATAEELVGAVENYLDIKDHRNRLEFVDSFITTLSWDNTWGQMYDKITNSLQEKLTSKIYAHV